MTAPEPGALTVAPAEADDLDAIDAIARAAFALPWPRQVYADELTRPQARVDVAWMGGRIVGYAITWAVLDEVDLLEIATAPEARRRGVGHALLAVVCARADREEARQTALEVRAGNTPARALYERCGFAVVAARKGYYADDGEDAVVMIRPRP